MSANDPNPSSPVSTGAGFEAGPVAPALAAASAKPDPAARRSLIGSRGFAIVALVIALIATFAALLAWQRTERIVREAARRLQEADVRTAQTEQNLRAAQDQLRDIVGRSAVLDNKVTELVGQQTQLERMYKSIAQGSLDSVLADVETSLSIASQQLVVGANVQGAMAALQDADAALKRADPGEVSGLRRLLNRDIERLRATPVVDLAGLAGRLDSLAGSLEQLPMLAGVAPQDGGQPIEQGEESGSTIGRLASTGLRGWHALKGELMSLVRVNRVDASDAMLIAPGQRYFVRENLRLTLLSARIALLSRSEPVFRADLERAARWLDTYYDRQAPSVAGAVASLRQLQSARVAVELPSLAESLSTVRTLRAAREGAN